jgi:uncharacterized protein
MKSTRKSSSTPTESFIRVKHSKVHGQGVFATRKIPAGTQIIEYKASASPTNKLTNVLD